MLERIEHGEICELRISRPPANALDQALVARLTEAIEKATESAGAIVISGQPGVFSAGLDVPSLLQLDHDGIADFWQAFFNLLGRIALSPVPIACAITGHSPAGGAVMAILTDYRVMAEGDYVIGLNEVAVGLVPPVNLQKSLARLVGPHEAGKLVIAGALIPSARALAIGMVDELAEDGPAAIERCVNWCRKHLALPRSAMLETRKIARQELVELWEGAGDFSPESLTDIWFTEQTQAALKGMVAKLKSPG
jgi:enoyl-CoA hydratase/carnithine racemase